MVNTFFLPMLKLDIVDVLPVWHLGAVSSHQVILYVRKALNHKLKYISDNKKIKAFYFVMCQHLIFSPKQLFG